MLYKFHPGREGKSTEDTQTTTLGLSMNMTPLENHFASSVGLNHAALPQEFLP